MSALTPVFIDFETYWSATHSLTKMNPIVYCTHPETELISCAVKVGTYKTVVLFGEKPVKEYLRGIDWSDKLIVAHNLSGFDAMLLAWRCGTRPKMWGCTLAMARAHHALSTGLSLAKLVAHYGLGVKDNTALLNTKGRHLCDFSAAEIEAMREYNATDTDQCAGLFYKLLPLTSKSEMQLIDMTVRMLVKPQFEVDVPLLAKTLKEEKERKKLMLNDVASMMGVYQPGMTDDEAATATAKVLGSSAKFAAFLRDCGVEPPMKPSPSNPEKQTYALAKTDEAFLALQEHDDPMIVAASLARLGVKSTILESRIETFLEVAGATRGRLPVPLNYYAAHTGRWGGSMALNAQNLPRVSGKPSDALRLCMRAPKGHKVVVADLSGIELRVNHFLWQVPSSMALFQADPEKADLYKEFAAKLYAVPVDEVTKPQRQVGKIAHLGLGFGAGAITFRKVAKTMGGVELSEVESQAVVSKWRGEYPEITQGWKTCHRALDCIDQGIRMDIDPQGLCYTSAEGIHTPQGMIRYPALHKERSEGKDEWWYGVGRHRTRIYAGRVTENAVQNLARCILADNMREIQKRYPIAHTVHDEVILVVPEDEAVEALAFMQGIMRTPPKWWTELIVWSEGSCADTYGEAK